MTDPCIIGVASIGWAATRANDPAAPIRAAEQAESAQQAFEADATIAHRHVRKEDETPSSAPEKFARLKEGLDKRRPGMSFQFSTGGRAGAGRERRGMPPLQPDMASLSVGSNNFPTRTTRTRPTSWTGSRRRCAPTA